MGGRWWEGRPAEASQRQLGGLMACSGRNRRAACLQPGRRRSNGKRQLRAGFAAAVPPSPARPAQVLTHRCLRQPRGVCPRRAAAPRPAPAAGSKCPFRRRQTQPAVLLHRSKQSRMAEEGRTPSALLARQVHIETCAGGGDGGRRSVREGIRDSGRRAAGASCARWGRRAAGPGDRQGSKGSSGAGQQQTEGTS